LRYDLLWDGLSGRPDRRPALLFSVRWLSLTV
jgi:hypothetical protein